MQVLQQRAFFNSSDLPVGYLFDPLAVPVNHLPTLPAVPHTCSACGAYVNPYTTINCGANRFHCNFCGKSNLYDERPSTMCTQCPDMDYHPRAWPYPGANRFLFRVQRGSLLPGAARCEPLSVPDAEWVDTHARLGPLSFLGAVLVFGFWAHAMGCTSCRAQIYGRRSVFSCSVVSCLVQT